jgi:hypothetical protein
LVLAALSVWTKSSSVSVSVQICCHLSSTNKLIDLRSGTGDRDGEEDGITASVRLIISNTDAIDPLGRVPPGALLTMLVPSSSPFRRSAATVFLKLARESRVMGLSDRDPGCRVRHLQYDSTNTITKSPTPISTPPSIQNRRLRNMRPSRIG